MHTLTKEAHANITLLHQQDYFIDNAASGVLLLKVIISEAHVDTNAAERPIQEELAGLSDYIMHDVGSDIIAFNKHIKILQKELTARGVTTNDLLTNLFKAYKEASDKTFITYILGKETKYNEGMTFTVP
jgi:hypothetical protein